MTPKDFIAKYHAAFGNQAPLPIVFGYSNTPATDARSTQKCIIGDIRKVRQKGALTLCDETITCRGGGLYTQFRPIPDGVTRFVSTIEHYKQTEDMVSEYIDSLNLSVTKHKYLNLVRIDKIDSFDDYEGIIFLVSPDILSGLCSWAFYDSNREDTVSTLFGSGCSSIISVGAVENRQGGHRCFIGMLDPSARTCVAPNELSLTIPMCRFKQMLLTLDNSALFQKAFSLIKKRITKSSETILM